MSVSFDFSDRTVIVTGAAQGIGAALARTFVDAGASVLVADLRIDGDAWWRDVDPGRIRAVACDVVDAQQCADLVEQVVGWTGSIDVLVNNAGITRDGVVWKLSDDDWSKVLDVHLTGTFNLTRLVIPAMRTATYGRIVNVTSYTGLRGNVGQANYAAAKAGIIGFTKTVAKEVAAFGITVNAISPNAETAMVAAVPAGKKAELESMVPLKRFGRPDEMSAGVAFLASEQAGYITGAVLPIDGGLSI